MIHFKELKDKLANGDKDISSSDILTHINILEDDNERLRSLLEKITNFDEIANNLSWFEQCESARNLFLNKDDELKSLRIIFGEYIILTLNLIWIANGHADLSKLNIFMPMHEELLKQLINDFLVNENLDKTVQL